MHNNHKKPKSSQIKLLRSLVATAFIASGLFPFAPALADGTAAGTSISNTATAEYDDPDSTTGGKIPATSNTVTVTVAEVAGITVASNGSPVDQNGGSVENGDTLEYNFLVTNTGNDPTRFSIPSNVTVTGPGTQQKVQYFDTVTSAWVDVPANSYALTGSVPAGGTLQVRALITVNTTAGNAATIAVTLGNTAATNGQNEPYVLNGAADASNGLKDLSTADNADPSTVLGEVTGPPVNGVREAAATSGTLAVDRTYSLATLLKDHVHNNAGTPGNTSDDTLTYNLKLKVLATDPTGQTPSIAPAPLAGTDIKVDGLTDKYILVSDAIPAGTQLDAIATQPTVPTGWQRVYTTEPVTTDANSSTTAWVTSVADLTLVKRVGFVKKINGVSDYIPTSDVNTTDFSVRLKVTAAAPVTIANIAQVFGSTPTNNRPVYDESGDQNPSNFNGSTPLPGTDTNGDGIPDTLTSTIVDDGYIDNPASPETGTDPGNNTGSGDGGEADQLIINSSGLFNGPANQPQAVGPTNNNDDFTNKSSGSADLAGTKPGDKINPSVINFTNTVQNTGSGAANISLLPTPPATATALPDNTRVTISNTAGTISATYEYNSSGTGSFTFVPGSGIGLANGNPVSATNPVRIDGVAATNGTADYKVSVDLPTNTDVLKGFPVPITAFVDTGTAGLDAADVQNITIDRVYTGFLQLLKYSRILNANGTPVGDGTGNDGSAGDFESTPAPGGATSIGTKAPVQRTPQPGQIIEYQIRYKNISQESTGTGSVLLNVNNLVITEDGTGANGNWALDQNADSVIDTTNVPSTAADSGSGANITYFSGNPASNPTGTADTLVTKYVNSISVQIAPGVERTFTFQRKVSGTTTP